eukprot:TRINITY_DN10320_c0_g1_i1.p1 TRINITY_DN10320_c0_g1~~TRINITY_DN10320_c0_g1_i1.p1  ORF type:complete len:606 (+),score=190.67 TRINITY_DN10320_c0_g1_i1:117-1934(+)
MGCGASNEKSAEAADPQRDTKAKYEQPKEGGAKESGTAKGAAPAAGGAAGDSPASPAQKKKKNKGGGRYGNPDYHARMMVMTDLTKVEDNATTSMFMLSTNKVVLKTEPAKKQQEQIKEFGQVARGEMVVKRGPPPDTTMTAEVHSDFCPPWSVTLSAEEMSAGPKLGGDCFLLDGPAPQQLVSGRLVPSQFKGMSIRVLTSFNRPISAVGISNDGRMVAIAQVRAKAIEPHRADKPMIATLAETGKGGSRGSVSSMTSLLNRFKIDAFSRTVRLHDLRTGTMVGYMKEKTGDPEVTSDFVFPPSNPEGLMSCTSDGTLMVWHTGKFRLVKKCTLSEGYPNPTRYTKLAISNNGKFMVGAADDLDDDAEDVGQVVVYMAEPGGFKHMHSIRNVHKHLVTAVALSPNNDLGVSGDQKGGVHVWNIENGNVLFEMQGHLCPIKACFFLPDANRVVTVCERYLRCWDITTSSKVEKPVPLWTRFVEAKEPTKWADSLEAWGGDEQEDEEEYDEPSERQSPRYMQPTANRSKHRIRVALQLFSNHMLFASTTRELIVLDCVTGEEVDRVSTRGVLQCGAALRSIAVLGDTLGMVYVIDFNTGHELPTFA